MPLEEHSVPDLVAEIHRLNQVCLQHEQVQERFRWQADLQRTSAEENHDTLQWLMLVVGFVIGMVGTACFALFFA